MKITEPTYGMCGKEYNPKDYVKIGSCDGLVEIKGSMFIGTPAGVNRLVNEIADIISRNARYDSFEVIYDGKTLSCPSSHPKHWEEVEGLSMGKIRATQSWYDPKDPVATKQGAVRYARELLAGIGIAYRIDEEKLGELVRKYTTQYNIVSAKQAMVAALDEMNVPNDMIMEYLGMSAPAVSEKRLKVKTKITQQDNLIAANARREKARTGVFVWVAITGTDRDEDWTICDGKEEAIEKAKAYWNHLTDREQKNDNHVALAVKMERLDDEDEPLDGEYHDEIDVTGRDE